MLSFLLSSFYRRAVTVLETRNFHWVSLQNSSLQQSSFKAIALLGSFSLLHCLKQVYLPHLLDKWRPQASEEESMVLALERKKRKRHINKLNYGSYCRSSYPEKALLTFFFTPWEGGKFKGRECFLCDMCHIAHVLVFMRCLLCAWCYWYLSLKSLAIITTFGVSWRLNNWAPSSISVV